MSAEAEQLLSELVNPPERTTGVQKVRYTHDAMINLILANPAISQNDLARHFGYSASWISQIIACDAFQARLAERSKELVDPMIKRSVEERFRGLVYRSLEILQEKLAKPADLISDQLALRSLELSSRAIGYGAKDTTVVQVNVTNHLEELGDNLVKLLRKKKAEIIDNEPKEDGND